MAVPVITKSDAVDTAGDAAERMVSRVNEQGAQRIMSMVVNMYSDPYLAVVREYTANAVDATIVAGTGVPVEVTTPTRLNPNFVVADRGTGMSKEELEQAFLAFAASTKTDTNDVIGGLGVGAKSAWTVCDAFLVNTVKDGKRNVVRASRDLEHEVLLSDAPTDDPNGTIITVPVSIDSTDWQQIIRRVAAAHLPGAVKVDGKDVPSIHALSQWIGPIHPNPLEGEEFVMVVSGGTLFGVPREIKTYITEKAEVHGAVVKLPVGSFEHTPSREHLIPSAATYRALDAALDEFKREHDKLARKVAKMAEKSPTKAVAMRVAALGSAQSHRRLLPINYRVVIPSHSLQNVSRAATASSPTVWKTITHTDFAELRTAHRDLIEHALLVTNVPAGRQLKGIGRYMDTHHKGKRVVIPMYGGQTEINFKVVGHNASVKDEGIGDGFTVSVKSAGITVVDYNDMRAEMKVLAEKARANRPAPQSRSYVVYIFRDGKNPLREHMTLAQVREYVEDNDDISFTVAVGQHSYHFNNNLVGDNAFILIDTQGLSINPVLKAIPEVEDAITVAHRFSEQAMERFDDEVFTAATILTSHHEAMYQLADFVYENTSDDDAVRSYVAPMVKAHRVLIDRHDEVEAAGRLIRGSYRSERKVEVTSTDLVGAFTSAYPLLPTGFRSTENIDREHILAYLKTVPPVAKAS